MNSPNQLTNDTAAHAIDYWQVLKNRYGVILLTLLLVFMTAVVITYVMPKKFESQAMVQVLPARQQSTILDGDFGGSVRRTMTASFFRTEFEVIRSPKVLKRVIKKLDLEAHWDVNSQTALAILEGIVKTDNPRGTDLIEISVRHTNKNDARDIAAEVAKAYQDRRNHDEREFIDRGIAAIEEQLKQQSDRVEEKRRAVEVIAKTRDIIDSSIGGTGAGSLENMIATKATTMSLELEALEKTISSQIASLLQLKSNQLIEYAAGLDLPENIVKKLHPKYIEEKRQFMAAQTSGYGPNHPKILARKRALKILEEDMAQGVSSLRETLLIKLDQVKDNLAKSQEIQSEKRDVALRKNIGLHDYRDAKRDYDMAVDMLQAMRLKYVGERATREMPREPIVMHADAEIGQRPVSPNVTLNFALGAITGLIFGVAIAFFLEFLDTSVKSLEDVERYLQVPVLAVIPKDVGVLHKQSGMSPDAEAYRILRTNIEFNRKNPDDNSITVVSGGAGEGKSTTLVNLAYICAQGGYTTLMIDGDLRRPRLHTFFDINNAVGLTNYLTTELQLEDVILQTPVDNLFFMPSGILPADAAGILNSRRMSELIQDVKQRFDLVLIDSPPILGVSDASVLASEVDLTMIVVQHRKLPRNMLMRVKQAVENVGGHVIGVVLNNVDVRSDSQYQYYTSYYTYYAPSSADPVPMAAQTPIEPTSSRKSDDSDLY